MAQNITVQGASYADVPAVTLPKTGGGTASFTDVSDTTAAAGDVASGKYFYTAAGVKTAGTASGGGGGSILPTGYTQLEYVMLSGTQYALLDCVPVQGDKIDCIFLRMDQNGCLFSAGTGTFQWLFLGPNYYKYFATGNAPTFYPALTNSRIYQLTADSSASASSPGLTTSVVSSSYGGALGSTEKLNFGRRANNSSYFTGYIFEFILSNSGTEKIHLVPCIQDSTEYVGFYDLVGETFIKSDGSGEFVAGPEALTAEEVTNILLGGA